VLLNIYKAEQIALLELREFKDVTAILTSRDHESEIRSFLKDATSHGPNPEDRYNAALIKRLCFTEEVVNDLKSLISPPKHAGYPENTSSMSH
jgi:hypothetical protein